MGLSLEQKVENKRMICGKTPPPEAFWQAKEKAGEKADGQARQVDIESMLDERVSDHDAALGAVAYELKMLRARRAVLDTQIAALEDKFHGLVID